MAKFDICIYDEIDFQKAIIKKEKSDWTSKESIAIRFFDKDNNFLLPFVMDKSTAIKFAKTLRTEINKIKESEVDNGGR